MILCDEPNQPRPYLESDGYAHPDDRVDRLGRLFATLGRVRGVRGGESCK